MFLQCERLLLPVYTILKASGSCIYKPIDLFFQYLQCYGQVLLVSTMLRGNCSMYLQLWMLVLPVSSMLDANAPSIYNAGS